MTHIRIANSRDTDDLYELYTRHLTQYPPKEQQDLALWAESLSRFAADDNYRLLVLERDGKAVSSVTLIIIENLTHNMLPYAVIENVVTHAAHRGKGFATRLLDAASALARERGCYKIMLMTGSKKESTLRFYENAGFAAGEKTAFIKRL